jgi:predicted SAM-dependent methyltransferase
MTGSGLLLELGSGHNRKGGWVNIDLFNREADFRLDLRRRLPFSNESVAEIHSEHFFEHLEYSETRTLLSECHRVLQPGGLLRTGVPDPIPAIHAYASGDRSFFENLRPIDVGGDGQHWSMPRWVETPMEHLNFMFHQTGDHRFIYDVETLTKLLVLAGFVDSHESPYDPNRDSEDRRYCTIYVDAIKGR